MVARAALLLLLVRGCGGEENPFMEGGDVTQECYTWAADGQCALNPSYMHTSCKYSCWEWYEHRNAKFPDAQIDRKFHCASWANKGECHKNQARVIR